MKKMFILGVLVTAMSACGQADEKAPASSDDHEETKTQEKAVVEIESISLDAKSDLPECSDSNRSQLAYVLEEDNFYVCQKAWKLISIKGKQGDKGEKGDKGLDGTTTTVHVDGGNSSNVWVDSISGFTWYLGGTNYHSEAVNTCQAPYRLPTINEAYAAITHGIRLIALDISANPDFWSSETVLGFPSNYYYITVINGAPSGGNGTPSTTASVFCVK